MLEVTLGGKALTEGGEFFWRSQFLRQAFFKVFGLPPPPTLEHYAV